MPWVLIVRWHQSVSFRMALNFRVLSLLLGICRSPFLMVGVCGCDTCMVVMQLIISSFPHAFYNTGLQMYVVLLLYSWLLMMRLTSIMCLKRSDISIAIHEIFKTASLLEWVSSACSDECIVLILLMLLSLFCLVLYSIAWVMDSYRYYVSTLCGNVCRMVTRL